jgi:hypothetical protein
VYDAWRACVLGAGAALEPGEHIRVADGEEEDQDMFSEERIKRIVEVYRNSTQARLASEAFDRDDSLEQALKNMARGKAPTLSDSDSD